MSIIAKYIESTLTNNYLFKTQVFNLFSITHFSRHPHTVRPACADTSVAALSCQHTSELHRVHRGDDACDTSAQVHTHGAHTKPI